MNGYVKISYGSWFVLTGQGFHPGDAVLTRLGGHADVFDIDAVVNEFYSAVNAALPNGVVLSMAEFFGPSEPDDYTWKGDLNIGEIVRSIDIMEIAKKHVRPELRTQENK